MSRRPILGVSLDGMGAHPAAWVTDDVAAQVVDIDRLVRLAQGAERGGFDFVSLTDSFDPDDAPPLPFRFDALLSLARIAPQTSAIALLATVTTTHTEPFHVSKNVATLDLISAGRAGWRVAVSTSAAAAERFGRKQPQAGPEQEREAADAVEVVRRLWDSWEDDAVIREVSTGRYIDRDKVHYIDFSGDFFSVRGPSITPRSPQGQPVVAADVDVDGLLGIDFAGRCVDLAIIDAGDADEARTIRAAIRSAAVEAGRDPDAVTVLVAARVGDASRRRELDRVTTDNGSRRLDLVGSAEEVAGTIVEWTGTDAADGFLLEPDSLPDTLDWLGAEVVPRLNRPSIVGAGASPSFRQRLGLGRPLNRYAAEVLT